MAAGCGFDPGSQCRQMMMTIQYNTIHHNNLYLFSVLTNKYKNTKNMLPPNVANFTKIRYIEQQSSRKKFASLVSLVAMTKPFRRHI